MNVRNLVEADRNEVEVIFDTYWDDEFRKNLSNKISQYLNKAQVLKDQNFQFLVLENAGKVVAVSAMRDAPQHMSKYGKTEKPVEFYVMAVNQKNMGYGAFLKEERIKRAREQGYSEVLFFSGETHKDSWGFHDSYAERVSEMKAPNGEQGYVWSYLL